jgi:WD40 repeat protein
MSSDCARTRAPSPIALSTNTRVPDGAVSNAGYVGSGLSSVLLLAAQDDGLVSVWKLGVAVLNTLTSSSTSHTSGGNASAAMSVDDDNEDARDHRVSNNNNGSSDNSSSGVAPSASMLLSDSLQTCFSSCVASLSGHEDAVCALSVHASVPGFVLSASSDSTVRAPLARPNDPSFSCARSGVCIVRGHVSAFVLTRCSFFFLLLFFSFFFTR